MKYAIQHGIITNQIFIGRLNKAQNMFLDDKEDATDLALHAVAEHVVAKWDGAMTLTVGKKKYHIQVEEE